MVEDFKVFQPGAVLNSKTTVAGHTYSQNWKEHLSKTKKSDTRKYLKKSTNSKKITVYTSHRKRKTLHTREENAASWQHIILVLVCTVPLESVLGEFAVRHVFKSYKNFFMIPCVNFKNFVHADKKTKGLT